MTLSNPQGHTSAYDAHQRQDESSRDTDKRALLACAGGLKEALDGGGSDMQLYGDKIRHNQRLWTIFQVALCDPDNQLPKELKILLLNISRYVDRTSFSAVGKFAPQLVTSLIDINRIIAAGLAKKASSAGALQAQAIIPPGAPGSTPVMTTA